MKLCMEGNVVLHCIGTEVGELSVLGPELVQQTQEKVDLIRQRLVAAQDRQTNMLIKTEET